MEPSAIMWLVHDQNEKITHSDDDQINGRITGLKIPNGPSYCCGWKEQKAKHHFSEGTRVWNFRQGSTIVLYLSLYRTHDLKVEKIA